MKLATSAAMEAYIEETTASLAEDVRSLDKDPTGAASARVMLAVWPAFFRAFDLEVRNHATAESLLLVVHALLLNIIEQTVNTCADDEYRSQTALYMVERLRVDLREVMAGGVPPGFRSTPVKSVKVS